MEAAIIIMEDTIMAGIIAGAVVARILQVLPQAAVNPVAEEPGPAEATVAVRIAKVILTTAGHVV